MLCRLASSPGSRAEMRSTRIPLRDRKSTRLNSSHVEISYAVFCLKKKRAAWLLVVLITATIPLPSVLAAARVDAIHAADAARDEVVTVLHAFPRWIQPIASRVAAIANATATPVRSGRST